MSKTSTTPKYKYNIFFTIEERGRDDKKGRKAKVLIDNEGFLCGIYATYKYAKIAIPKIRRNLVRQFKKRDRLKKGSH